MKGSNISPSRQAGVILLLLRSIVHYSKPFIIVVWYRPPNSISEAFSYLENLVGRLDSENVEFYLMGDVNCNMALLSDTKAPSTRIRKFVKTQIFFYEYGLRPHVSSVFSGRIRKFLKTLSRVEIFKSDPIRYEYVYVWTVVSANLRIHLRHFLGSSLHVAHYKQTKRTARLYLLY